MQDKHNVGIEKQKLEKIKDQTHPQQNPPRAVHKHCAVK
jgi:hypothetical protein